MANGAAYQGNNYIQRRQCIGCHRARCVRSGVRSDRANDRCWKSRGCRWHARCQCRRESAAGWLYAARTHVLAHRDGCDLCAVALRHCKGFRSGHPARQFAERSHCRQGEGLSVRARPSRGRQGQAGQLQLCVGRCRYRVAFQRRAFQTSGKVWCPARSLQGRTRSSARNCRRPGRLLLRAAIAGQRAYWRGSACSACGQLLASRDRLAGRSDYGRGGVSELGI